MKVDESINKELHIYTRAKTRESINGVDVLKWGTKALKLGMGFIQIQGDICKLRNKRGKKPWKPSKFGLRRKEVAQSRAWIRPNWRCIRPNRSPFDRMGLRGFKQVQARLFEFQKPLESCLGSPEASAIRPHGVVARPNGIFPWPISVFWSFGFLPDFAGALRKTWNAWESFGACV